MSKFKVGDRVKVKKPKLDADNGCRWLKDMDCFDDMEVEVESTNLSNRDRFLATNGFYFLDDWVVGGASHPPISPHYTTDADGKDYLQRFFENESPEAVRGAMVFTMGKYIDRLGKKDAVEKELAKVIDYCTRYRDFLTK